MGRTGSGKTSLLRVLLRMYPYAGVVKIDGVDTKTVPIDILRSRVAVIPQASSFVPGGRCAYFSCFSSKGFKGCSLHKSSKDVDLYCALRSLAHSRTSQAVFILSRLWHLERKQQAC